MKKYINDYKEFDEKYTYDGGDLGVVVDGEYTRFKIWAPLCTAVTLNLYTSGEGDNRVETLCMRPIEKGVWYVELHHDVYGMYYTYTLEFDHSRRVETIDVYAKACGANGERGYIADFKSLNPEGWEDCGRIKCENPVDAVIYECHVRDFSVSETSGVQWYNRGRFTGFTEEGTRCGSVRTCLDHLKELGITHVQLMPVADYATVNEKKPYAGQYNWGYDPKNYMCLEGYYCTDAEDGDVRIREFKQLVAALHKAGIGVILDVVYNHTYYTEESAFHKTVPYYYHRLDKNGNFSNGSGCGNETASDHAMMRNFMLHALKFWVNEYKIDGFRFDLMGLHDIDTINMIRDELDKIDPSIMMYGEGWTGGESPYLTDKLCYKWNSYSFGRVGLFNDNIRDGIKGGTFNLHETGFVNGNGYAFNAIKRGITANARYTALQGTADDLCWAFTPAQAINYCEAHDNHTLWDKLAISAKSYTDEERRRMDKLAAALVILSQGVPFIQLGQDFLRTKPKVFRNGETPDETNIYDGNSYNAPDHTNMIRWDEKEKNFDIFTYYKALIALRRSSPLFRMRTSEQLDSRLFFHDRGELIAYELSDNESGENYFIIINRFCEDRWADLPGGVYYKRLDENGRPDYRRFSGSVMIPRISCAVFKRL
ncbi:MAG: type I pullulanase [Oscillospiraceae bacterium]